MYQTNKNGREKKKVLSREKPGRGLRAMQSCYGSSEIQQFMVDGSVHSTLFSISAAAPNPAAASHNITSGGDSEWVRHSAAAASNTLKLFNPFHHQHHPAGKSPPPLVPMEFPHFHSIPITQQLFTRMPHPRHHQHQFQLFNNNPANYDQHRRVQSILPLLDQEPHADNISATGGTMPSFLAANMNFKLAVYDGSESRRKDGLNNDETNIAGGLLHGDDASESSFRLWQREEEEECAIKEPFWRPLDLDCVNHKNKRCRYKDLDEHRFTKRSREAAGGLENSHPSVSGSNYKLFSELEAIYRPRNSTSAAVCGAYKNPTTANDANETTASGSALTGDENPVMPTTFTGEPESRVDASNSFGCEACQNIKRIHQHSRRPRHRKKVREESIAAFFEGLVKQLMDHQDLLHQKFIDTMEQRDGERAGQEEARRSQEAARALHEAAGRAQDRTLAAARGAAMISFLETITRETLNLPSHPQQIGVPSSAISEEHLRDNCEGAVAPTTMKTSRWPKAEVQALIAVRSGLEGRFQEPGLKGRLWEEVSASMTAVGYQRSAKRCKEKWENINKYFRKAKYSGRKRSQHSKTCPYFQQLDLLYSNPLPNSKFPPQPDGPNKNSDLLDAVVVSGASHRGFAHKENIGKSEEGCTPEEEEGPINELGFLIETLP